MGGQHPPFDEVGEVEDELEEVGLAHFDCCCWEGGGGGPGGEGKLDVTIMGVATLLLVLAGGNGEQLEGRNRKEKNKQSDPAKCAQNYSPRAHPADETKGRKGRVGSGDWFRSTRRLDF